MSEGGGGLTQSNVHNPQSNIKRRIISRSISAMNLSSIGRWAAILQVVSRVTIPLLVVADPYDVANSNCTAFTTEYACAAVGQGACSWHHQVGCVPDRMAQTMIDRPWTEDLPGSQVRARDSNSLQSSHHNREDSREFIEFHYYRSFVDCKRRHEDRQRSRPHGSLRPSQ